MIEKLHKPNWPEFREIEPILPDGGAAALYGVDERLVFEDRYVM
jgi:hypothetical protein